MADRPRSPARIVGWGSALPEKVVTNHDLEATLDTSDEWIVERTGIRERRIGGSTSGLAIDAARAALTMAGVDGDAVEAVVLATSTPDEAMPATASVVQQELGVRGGAMDLNAACSGFVYALVTADGLLRAGLDRVLVIGAETMSRIVDWDDRSTAILFGDGAGAVVVERSEGPGRLLGFDLGSDGTLRHILHAPVGGTIEMDGPEVFRRAVRVMVDSAERALADAGVGVDDLALFVPHQANVRIIDAAARRLGIPEPKVATNLAAVGNTSAASIPLVLTEAAAAGRLTAGDLVLTIGFGAGMSWASAVLEWAR
ncbi:MAG TPA: beta-ketoacyl-ACP synthase III [Acidimicrobiales bacterium]|nr:beta-ketoacyl-ACP synthase III [Acidimicrobiales bacterium]